MRNWPGRNCFDYSNLKSIPNMIFSPRSNYQATPIELRTSANKNTWGNRKQTRHNAKMTSPKHFSIFDQNNNMG